MSKIRIFYTEFKNARKTTELSQTISRIEILIGVTAIFAILGGLVTIANSQVEGTLACFLGVGILWGYRILYNRLIYPWLLRKAQKERIEFAEMLRKANEDPIIDEKQLLRDEMEKLLDKKDVDKADLLRIGELTEMLESMGEKVL